MQKPYRFLVDRVTGYAEEGSAFLRRRKIRSRPFVRIWRSGDAVESIALEAGAGERLTAVAVALLDETPRKR